MNRKLSILFTALVLIGLMASFHFLIEHWVVTISKAIPSAFTLGMTTVLVYKSLRYPRGTVFTLFGLLQIGLILWIGLVAIETGLTWILLPLSIAVFVFAPKSAKASWKWFGVDRYYQKKTNA